MEDAGTTNDVNDVIAVSHWFAIGSPEVQGPTQVFCQPFQPIPTSQKSKGEDGVYSVTNTATGLGSAALARTGLYFVPGAASSSFLL